PASAEAPDDPASRDEVRFAMKMQQYTAPVQAKGVEDTAFYRYHVLISNNEVGSELTRFTETLGQFHAANRRRAEQQPRTMLATATHDTKRGEDARARIVALSELPAEWAAEVERWAKLTRAGKTDLDGSLAPDANDEYFFYQVLLGAWDFDGEARGTAPLQQRLQAYLLKAGREAKLKTSWLAPNEAYEKATADFVAAALSNRAFLDRFLPFARRVAELGALSSLSRTLLKAASPGVSDFFQGSELWDLSLVDPDNRRPVDYGARREMLAALEPLLSGGAGAAVGIRGLLENWPDARLKMFVTAKALRCRRGRRELFLKGGYAPLELRGRWAERFIAFRRAHGGEEAVVVAPRLLVKPLWKKGAAGARSLTHATFLVPPAGGFPPLEDAFTGARLAANGSLRQSLPALPLG